MGKTKYNPEIHHRRSIRLKGYDYGQPGAYFVTLCVQDRVCVLGEIVRDAMTLSDWGRIAAQSWLWLEEQYPHVALDVWVVMPNHLHGIVILLDDDAVIEARHDAPRRHKPLGQLIGAFKTTCTKRINQLRGTPGTKFWQRNYYEHIVRDARDMARIRQYIIDNPRRWKEDVDNPANTRQLPFPTTVNAYLADAAHYG
jgi:REP element-mobilizing transposase RayT